MAEPVLLSDCKVYLGGYDLTGAVNGLRLTAAKAMLPNGRMGDGCEVVSPGLTQPSANVKGFWSAGTGEPDAVLWPKIDAAAALVEWPLTFAPPSSPAAAAGAAGNLAYELIGHQFAYKQGAAHGENLPFEFDTKPSSLNNLVRGQVGLAKALISVTTTGAAQTLGLLAADEQMVVALHVFAIVGGSWVLTLESDDNGGFATPTVRGTMTAITTAPNQQVLRVSGPIATDTFWRVVITKTGGTSLTPAVTIGKFRV